MQAGRPVLVMPAESQSIIFDNVLVAWKNTREARRAVLDALPLLQNAKDVTVVEILEHDDDKSAMDDVIGWLGGHAVKATGLVRFAADSVSAQLDLIATDAGADILVAGAYGHTRLGEWVFGGVTHDRLTRSKRCSLLSH
jgi:nucleotide-binding universal stress UspA family protein